MDQMNEFRRAWVRVGETYRSGSMVYERGLQAALYEALRGEFRERRVVVEPRWGEQPNVQVPDLVIVSQNYISDIFELKFTPHWQLPIGEIDDDIRKLLGYRGEQHVTLDPLTGQWDDEPLPIRADCRRHIVVVARANSPAVLPENIPDQLILWYGRIHVDPNRRCWGICQGTQID